MAFELTRSGIMSRLGGGGALLSRSLSAPSPYVQTPEVILSSFVFGTLQGRCKAKGGCTLFGLPIDLLAGAAFHVAAMLPMGRRHAHHLRAFGDGALASFFTTTGYRVGERWGAGSSLKASLSGIFGDKDQQVTGGASLADEELAKLTRA